MINITPLLQLPILPVIGLLWRAIDQNKKKNYKKNWRMVNEQAIYALVATAIKRSDNNLNRAVIPSPADIKELYIDSTDHIIIHQVSEGVLRALKTVTRESDGKFENIEQALRELVLNAMNNMIATYVRTAKTFNQRDLQRNLKYAEEQIRRARELGFDDVAKSMEYRLKLIFKDQ